MIKSTVTISNKLGLHARASAKLTKLAGSFPCESNVLEVYIRYLRQKLEGEGEARLIHTVRGVGYVMRENP